MSKHMYSDVYHPNKKVEWFCPVELISAQDNKNIDCIWKHANELREMLGEDNIRLMRQDQMKKSMWNYLGESLMFELK